MEQPAHLAGLAGAAAPCAGHDRHQPPLEPAGEDVAWLLDTAALYLLTRGEPGSARPLSERALTDFHRMLGEDHPDTLASVNNLALDLWALGEHEQAREWEEYVRSHRR